VLSDDPKTDQLPLKHTSVEVNIAGVIADVTVTQYYSNEGKNTLEALYLFPCSTKAAVHAMKMTIGEREVVAKIKERKEARKDYEQARKEGKTASLLEQMRPNVFMMNLANILPGDEIKVELKYTELLVPEDNIYEFVYPTVVGPRYSNQADTPENPDSWIKNPYLKEGQPPTATFDLDVKINGGLPLSEISSPSHEVRVAYASKTSAEIDIADSDRIANRDFILRYALAGKQIEHGLLLYPGENESFFLLNMQPPKRIVHQDIIPREYVFIVDVSGSMHGFPLEISKKLMAELLDQLRPQDAFNVLLFAGGSAVLSSKSLWATKANITRAKKWISAASGGGGTELLPALKTALALPRMKDASRTVVIATDGYVSIEKQAFELVRDNLGKANLFAFGIGSGVNRFLIEGLARAGMGEPFVITKPEGAQEKAERFMKYISSPLMQNIKVEFDGFEAYDVEPAHLPDMFADRPIVLFGKYKNLSQGRIKIKGQAAGQTLEGEIDLEQATVSKDNSALRLLWARHRIMRLADMNKLDRDDQRIKQVTELGLKYSLMTDYTSFIAIDSKARAQGGQLQTVKQPLPLPQGVSNYAVGGQGVLSVMGTGSGGGGAVGNVFGGVGGLGLAKGRGYGMAKLKASPQAVVMGSIDKSAIQRVIKKYNPQIKAFYARLLTKDPSLAGKVVVKLTIGSKGNVIKAEIVSDTTKNKALKKFILKKVKAMKFPIPQGGGEVVVNYPFIFKPAGQ
jgi:Ca-activated chloride channel family protein